MPLDSPSPRPRFQTTCWSEIVLAARGVNESDAGARASLENLCNGYWYPVYAFVRQQGHSQNEAEDLTQGFFLKLLDKDYLLDVDPARGRFRTFLLACLKHFLSDERDRRNAKKRGGDKTFSQLDFSDAEQRYATAAMDQWTPDAVFDRAWALSLLQRVLKELAAAYEANGKRRVFDALRDRIVGASPASKLHELAADLETTTGALKVAVHRLRKEYRQKLAAEVAATLGHEDHIADERDILLRALTGDLRGK